MAENYFYSSLSGQEIENRLLGGVLFNTDQTLTSSQKAIARANIGAGESNSTFKVLGYFNTLAEMQAALQTLPKLGDAYGIGTESPYDVYVYAMHMEGGQAVPGWVNQGPIDTSAAAFDDEDISVRTGWTSSKIASELTNVQRRLVIDEVPTLGSGNPVASGGVAVKMEWKKIVSENVSVPVNRWASSAKYDGYGFRAQIPIENVTADMIPEVIFDPADVSTGTFATIAESYNGGIYIYASEVPSAAITIPTIIVWRGDTGDGSDIPVIRVDPTLTVSGAAADAKAAGDAIRANTTAIGALQTTVDRKAGALVDTASGAIASLVPDATIPDLLGVTVDIEPVQAGSGDPSPDNVRPISGWDAVKIDVCGNNLLPDTVIWHANNGSTFDGANADANDNRARTTPAFDFPYQGTFTISGLPSNATSIIQVVCFDKFKNRIGLATVSGFTFTPQPDTAYIYILLGGTGFTTSRPSSATIQIEQNSTPSAFKPYTGNTYTIQLGQTVYGGTLNVTAGTLTIDRAILTLRSNVPRYASQVFGNGYERIYYRFSLLGIQQPAKGGLFSHGVYLENFTQESGHFYTTSTDFIVFLPTDGRILAYLDAQEQAGHPVQICYPLATPITITLDPVTISTISGQTNNAWADAGDVSVEYAADIKSYIDRLNQPTEDDMIANTLIAANKYFTVNNKLYLSTASIAAGAQIIPGHNCTETSLVEALNALNA